MADFLFAYNLTAKSEGGYSIDPNDSGNWVDGKLIGSNFGVSASVLKTYLKRTPTVEDMKNISLETVHNIYNSYYWKAIRGDEINNNQIAATIYDAAVNTGVKAAILITQRDLGLKETGIMNDETLNALNNL